MNANSQLDELKPLHIGWAQADITPDQKVYLAGQHYARISEGVMDPVTATALAVESANSGGVVMVSCDLVGISDELRDAVRAGIRSELAELEPLNVFLNATHTHAAPLARVKKRYAPATESPDRTTTPYGIELEAMDPADYIDFAADRIVGAVKDAWRCRKPSGIGYGIGHAVVARNRRLTYKDGTSKMYGNAGSPEFSHVEGVEDHSVSVMTTYDQHRNLTGMIVNVPCPSQVSEHAFQISADYWHETRQALRARFGEQLHVLAQCAPAGDLSPRVLVGKRAEARMWRLKGRDLQQNAPREEIALKIANAVSDIVPCAAKEIDWNPVFSHKLEVVELARRKLSEQDVEDALKEASEFKKAFETLLDEVEQNPEIRKQERWYQAVTRPYMKMKWNENVPHRFRWQQDSPVIPMELHVVRLGEIAIATNPFELYLDYAIRMRELSKATQTFLVQLTGAGSYLPSRRTLAHKGYGSVPASTDVGPEGGEQLLEWTTTTINEMF